MFNILTTRKVDRYSDTYPVPALVFNAAVGCGKSFEDVAVVLEPESSNPCLLLSKPLGLDAVRTILDRVKPAAEKVPVTKTIMVPKADPLASCPSPELRQLLDEKEVARRERVVKALKYLARDRDNNRRGARLLDHCYGPESLPLRCKLIAFLTDQDWTRVSRRESQWGNFRKLLLQAVQVKGDCIASEDADFERRAEEIMAQGN